MRRASPAKFEVDHNYVTVSYDDAYTGERIERVMFCPNSGGYVREVVGINGNNRQVCERLEQMGTTLWATPEYLPKLIRKEYAAMRRAERAESARYR